MDPLTIAQAAELTGLTAHTLRYYERDGLLPRPVHRATSGHRRYSEHDLRWIEMITRLRSTGMSIADIRRYAELARAGEGTEAERMDLLVAHRAKVEAQVAEVTAHLRAIDYKIGFYSHVLQSQDAERPAAAS